MPHAESSPKSSVRQLRSAHRPLGEIRQRGGKRVIAFAVEVDFDVASLHSNAFEIKWPPKSGRFQSFPEVDLAMWLDLQSARSKILSGQAELLDRLETVLSAT